MNGKLSYTNQYRKKHNLLIKKFIYQKNVQKQKKRKFKSFLFQLYKQKN